jgi:phenylacetate-CoA ligase
VMDELIVQLEYTPDIADKAVKDSQLFENFKEEITTRLKSKIGIRPAVELLKPNTLERTEFKSRRVIDKRDFIKRVE